MQPLAMTTMSSFDTFEKMWKGDDSVSLQALLESQYRELDSRKELLKEINIQTRALARDGNYLTSLQTRYESTLAILKIITVDGCSLESRSYYERLRSQLEDRIAFFANVVEQRQNSILYGEERLETIGQEQKNEKLE
jgi:hypothetical protein